MKQTKQKQDKKDETKIGIGAKDTTTKDKTAVDTDETDMTEEPQPVELDETDITEEPQHIETDGADGIAVAPYTDTFEDPQDEVDKDLNTDTDMNEEPQQVETENKEQGATVELRRSKRDRKPPKKFESYQMHQITNRPHDRKLETLHKLLGSGVLNDLDSEMSHNIIEAIMK